MRMVAAAALLLLLAGCGNGSGLNLAASSTAFAPQITMQPADQSVFAGQTATFSVTAQGTPPVTYQWSRDGVEIAGATAGSYTTAAALMADNASTFSVTVSNTAGAVTSNTAMLTVAATATAPAITQQPAAQNVVTGQSATFKVTASGTAPLMYQWSKGAAVIASAASASYTTPATAASDNGATFKVTVSNGAGSVTSNSAALTVQASATLPTITQQPANKTVVLGQAATFSVAASGTAPLTYQWLKGTTNITGAMTASYTTPATVSADNGATFKVKVSNGAGSVTSSSATLTVQAMAGTAPTISVQPANQTVTAGQTATFSVSAAGTAPLSYQWSRGGAAISGATASSYSTPATTSADNATSFSVRVTNASGSVTSNNATLTVQAGMPAPSQSTNVTTYKFDNGRSGGNSTESVLTLSNVNSTNFGLLRNLVVDGKVDAQPLYLSKLSISGASHNVLYVATEHASLYAFDADTGSILWQRSALPSGETPSDPHSCNQISPEIGITATPVIDKAAGAHGTIYLVAMSKDASAAYHQRIHALDITTGQELLGGPFDITAMVSGNGNANTFVPGTYAERAALLLSNGTIYTSFTSHCDSGLYSGWVVAFDQSTLAKTSVLNLAPNSARGPAIWMAGDGPAADAVGNVYLLTGNGAFETALDANGFPNQKDYGNAFVKIATVSGALTVADYFTMHDTVVQSNADQDLGSGGLLLFDTTDNAQTAHHLAVGAGKDGNMYIVNRDNLGKFSPSANNIYQQLSGALGGGVWSTPAYFNATLYYGEQNGPMKAFPVSNAKLATVPASQTALSFPYPGTSPVISANGSSNAIVWAHENSAVAVLHAYDAANLGHELYNSKQAANNRDQFGAGNKWVAPGVADGKVFIGTQNSVAVFGLLH